MLSHTKSRRPKSLKHVRQLVDQRRDLTERDKIPLIEVTIISQLLIEKIDVLRGTKPYEHRIALTGNAFQSAVEKWAETHVWDKKADDVHTPAAMDQTTDGTALLDRLLIAAIQFEKRSLKEQEDFNWELDNLIAKYKLK